MLEVDFWPLVGVGDHSCRLEEQLVALEADFWPLVGVGDYSCRLEEQLAALEDVCNTQVPGVQVERCSGVNNALQSSLQLPYSKIIENSFKERLLLRPFALEACWVNLSEFAEDLAC